MAQKRLAIVGGGYIGIELAKGLDATLDVTLVEPRDHFVHAPAMIRSLVDPALHDTALIPYDRLLKKGTLVKDSATAITGDGVTLASGGSVAADYIVMATGASNGGVFKPEGADIAAFRAAQKTVSGQIASASSIVIVGAGAVGTELAGEIAHAYPDKTLTLVSADAALFPGFPDKLGATLTQKLKSMGVDLVLGERVTDLKSTTEPYAGQVTLSGGKLITADLVIPAIGSKPTTTLFDGLPDITKASDGRVKVDDFLRPSSFPNVFSAGDAIDAGDAMTIVAASRQQPWLAKTLKALASGKSLDAQKPYTPWKTAPILVPLGPERGSSFLMIATLGDWVTKTAKGKDLFIGKYRKILGYA